MSVSNIISFDCIVMSRVVSLHLSFNANLPYFLLLFSVRVVRVAFYCYLLVGDQI